MKRICITICIILTLCVSSMSFAFADNHSMDIKALDNALNNLEFQKKERIIDLFSLSYVVVTNERPNYNEKSVQDYENEALEIVEYLAQLSTEELDVFIKDRIDSMMQIVKITPNASLTEESYDIVNKYGFSKDANSLKAAQALNVANAQNKGLKIAAVPDRTYSKTRYISFSTALWSFVGGVEVNANWKVLNSKITTYGASCSGESGSHLWQLTLVSKKGIQNAGQRAQILLTSQFEHLVLPSSLTFQNDVWVYNDGGIDVLFL